MNKEVWIKQMYAEYLDNKDKFTVNMFKDIHWRNVVELSVITQTKTISTRAICMKTDEFIKETGIAIAYARYKGYKIPNCIFDNIQTVESIPTGSLFYCPNTKKRYVKVSKMDGARYCCTEVTKGKRAILYYNEEVEIILIKENEKDE